MHIKNLITLTLFYSLIQAMPVLAGFGVTSEISQNSAINQDNSAVQANCGAQIQTKLTDVPLTQLFVDLSNGQSLSNALYAFQGSDNHLTVEAKNSVDYDAISKADVQNCHVNEVPVPAAVWLFASALVGFITFSNRRRA
jgi:hypothetical protein